MRAAFPAFVAWLLLGLVTSSRVKFGARRIFANRLNGEQDASHSEVPYPASETRMASDVHVLGQAQVDFTGFMTSNFSYQARRPSVWGWIKRKFFAGRRQFSNLKDELSAGHICNRVGERSHTYYASSLCYWLPEIPAALADHEQGSQGPGLKWVADYSSGQQLCGAFSGGGRCMKCSVCHNNGRTADGSVEATPFEEDVLDLPEGCLKETAIETICTGTFRSNHTSLVAEKEGCERLEGAYDRTVRELAENIRGQQEQETLIQRTLPAEISSSERQISHLQGVKSNQERQIVQERRDAERACWPYRGEFWWRMLDSFHDVDNLLRSWPDFWCPSPHSPWCDRHDVHDWDCQHEWEEYEHQRGEHEECQRCGNARNQVLHARDQLHSTEVDITRYQDHLRDLHDRMSVARGMLQRLQNDEAGLRAAQRAAQDAWLPERDRCRKVYADYQEATNAWMVKEIPKYYDQSCERACVQSSLKDAGCGVMEGVMRGEIWQSETKGPNPGIDVVCSPQSASFIRTPTKYGAAPETEFNFCKRIYEHDGQVPRRPQSIVKQGMLWKRERLWWRWRTRYFALESGDDVRSAVLRYWDKNPSEDPSAEERGDKAIVLWDALAIEPLAGRRFSRGKDSECMVLKHFYRQYLLCTTHGGAAERDAWAQLLSPEIKFQALSR